MSNHSRRVSHLVGLEKLHECLQWVLAHYSIERAAWIVNRLTAHLQNGEASGIFASATSIIDGDAPLNDQRAVDRQRLCGVAIAIGQPGNSATLLALHVVGDVSVKEVLEPLVVRLSQTGKTFIQSGCDDDAHAKSLVDGGFEPLAKLVMMSLEAEQFPAANELARGTQQASPEPAAVTWVALDQAGEDWRLHLNDVAGRTFIQTQDCPRLSDFRSADDIVEGYVAAAHFDPKLASLIRVGDDWAGCLILTSHAGAADDEPGVFELTYMGLVPEFRGRGLAGHLMTQTIGQATNAGASRVVLAVDHDNRPAAAIYRRLGWRDVISETVWGRKF